MARNTPRITISRSQGGQGNGEDLSLHTKFPLIKRVDDAWEKRTGHVSGDQSWEYTASGMSCPNRDSEMSPCGKFQFSAAYSGISQHTSCPAGPLTCTLAACFKEESWQIHSHPQRSKGLFELNNKCVFFFFFKCVFIQR